MINKIGVSTGDTGIIKTQNIRHDAAKTYAVSIGDAAPVFEMLVGSEKFVVIDKAHIKNINEFLGTGGENRADAVAAVLFKGIEPTKENLEMAYGALHGNQILDEAVLNQAIEAQESDAESAIPKDVIQKIRAYMRENGFSFGADDDISVERIQALRTLSDSGRHSAAQNSEIIMQYADRLSNAVGEGIAFADIDSVLQIKLDASANINEVLQINLDAVVVNNGALQKSSNIQRAFLAEENSCDFSAAAKELVTTENLASHSSKSGGAFLSAKADFRAEAGETSAASTVDYASGIKNEDRTASPKSADTVLSDDTADGLSDVDSADTASKSVDEPASDSSVCSAEDFDGIEMLVDAAISGMLEALDSVVQSFDLRTYLVTEQTEVTIRAAREFRAVQTSVLSTLKNADLSSVRSAIEALNSAINKSAFAMLSDMKTEKTLLLSIARLEEASAAFGNRDYETARRIVREVSEQLEVLNFKPSIRKIKLMAQQKLAAEVGVLPEKPVQRVASALSLFSGGSARDMLELARFTGINHEIEKYEATGIAGGLKNLKEIFGDGNFSASLTGQQMLNDSDGRRRSFYVFEVPVEADGEVGGLKVFVNGKCDENVIDWRNTDVYFALRFSDREKLGLRFSINGANVKIDMYGEETLDWSGLEDELAGIGYRLVSVRQNPLSDKPALLVEKGASARRSEEKFGRERSEYGFEAKI